MKKISVIIPTYNRAATIERAVRSVLVQTYPPDEIIVVDDGSTDETEQLVQTIGDERIVYHKLGQNGGVSAARNIGVQLASGEWLAFQDSDDCWRKEKLQLQMDYAAKHPEYPLIYSAYRGQLPDGRSIQMPIWYPGEYPFMGEKPEGEMFPSLLVRNTVGAPTILIKRESFLETGGFDERLGSLEDWEFVLRFAKEYPIGYVDQVLVDAYLSDSGVSSAKGAYFETRCRVIATYYGELVRYGSLEQVLSDLFTGAERAGVLEQVKRMLLIGMRQKNL